MIDKIILDELRGQLLQRRKEIMEMRESAEDSWQSLQEPEIEPEETSAKENLSLGAEPLEARRHRQVQKIDHAIAKMEQGVYGDCEGCGMPISMKRLKAIPWSRHCIRCAKQQESFRAGESMTTKSAGDTGDQYDEEIRETILSELADDGRVEMEELAIECENGVVFLKGVLPSHNSREVLWEIVSDSLGYQHIVEEVKIDRQLWERRERTPGNAAEETPEKEVRMDGQPENTDAFTSQQEGEPMQPPDRMKPENEE